MDTDKLVAAFVALCAMNIASAFAETEEHEEESHSFLQLSFAREKPADEDLTLTGLAVLARYDINEHVFVRAEIENLSDGDVDEEVYEAALAYILNPHSRIEYHLAALAGYEKEKEAGESSSADSWGAELGFHAELNHSFTLHGELAHVIESSEGTTGAELGLFWKITEHFGANIEFARDEDENEGLELGVRWTF